MNDKEGKGEKKPEGLWNKPEGEGQEKKEEKIAET